MDQTISNIGKPIPRTNKTIGESLADRLRRNRPITPSKKTENLALRPVLFTKTGTKIGYISDFFSYFKIGIRSKALIHWPGSRPFV
jgi:hypothetical protein